MRLIGGLLIGLFALSSQANEPTPTFEVVSIKPSEGAAPARFDRSYFHFPAASLKILIVQAYKVRSEQIDGPSWLNGPPFFDLTAKLPQGATKAQIPAMYQAMLAERFKLKFHWEARMEPIYELFTEKSGAKLKKSHPAAPAGRMNISGSGHYSLHGATLEQFALMLSNFVGRQVFDKSGVSGTFDIDFDAEAPAELRQKPPASGAAASDDTPSIFSVVHSLGLKLQPGKAEVKHLVVDSALEMPTEN